MPRYEYKTQVEVANTTLTRKTSKEIHATRTKTDTGRWGE